MNIELVNLSYEVELQIGEQLALPNEMIRSVGAGRWLITITPLSDVGTRPHDAFLNGYSPEDEGLYDDYSAG